MSEKEKNCSGGNETRVVCDDIEASLAHYTDELGYAVDEVFPADSPRLVIVSKGDRRVRLVRAAATASVAPSPGSIVALADAGTWTTGRAGMAYRDLMPDRRQGRAIASHIRIADGGPVPDYVHFHHVTFQVIFCIRGWVRVVYEDQGPPFVMTAGDCVLQPPRIRHRVLECSDGLEVVEIGAPAEHRTLADREMALPNATIDRERRFGGQRFVFHRARAATWLSGPAAGWTTCDCGIREGSGGLGSVVVWRSSEPRCPLGLSAEEGLSFQFILRGAAGLRAGAHRDWQLSSTDAFVVPDGGRVEVTPAPGGVELLRVTLRESNPDS